MQRFGGPNFRGRVYRGLDFQACRDGSDATLQGRRMDVGPVPCGDTERAFFYFWGRKMDVFTIFLFGVIVMCVGALVCSALFSLSGPDDFERPADMFDDEATHN